MTLRSASCSPKHTENTPITAVRKVCQSVSRLCLSRSIEQGNLWEKEISINQLVFVSQDHHELQAARAEQERKILQKELWRPQKDFREVHQQNITEMEELRKIQSSTFDTLTIQKFIEDQNTNIELSGRVLELQNEVNCMNDSKDFQDAESVRSGNSHVTSRPVSFPPHPILEGLLKHSFVSPRRKEGPPSIWDTHGISGNVFANPKASSTAPYPQELNPC